MQKENRMKTFPLSSEYFSEYKDRDQDEDESDYEFYTPKELETIPEHPNFENEEEIRADMPDLESEESGEQRRKQKGQGLKILTPQQMLSRLPISLAQLKAGNNSEKLENDSYCISCIDKKTKQNNLKVFDECYVKMETIFMNTLNSKTNEYNKFIYQFTDKLNKNILTKKNLNKNMVLANLSIYYTWKNIKSEYNNNKFKMSGPTSNDEFTLPDWSYSVFDIQDYFEYIIEKHETTADNHPV